MNNHVAECTALEMTIALSEKHWKDFFTTECNSGPAGRGVYRFDGVAIKKSWSTPCIIGYEIKRTRSDFKQDNKFYAYLPFFHELSIVCPRGLIDRNELPENIGLIWYDPEKKTLRTKKKAPYRNIEISAELLLHIFMSHLDSDRIPFYKRRREFAEDWLKSKESDRIIGSRFGTELTKRVSELSDQLEAFRRVKDNEQIISEILAVMKKHVHQVWGRRDIVAILEDALPRSCPDGIYQASSYVKTALKELEKVLAESEKEKQS